MAQRPESRDDQQSSTRAAQRAFQHTLPQKPWQQASTDGQSVNMQQWPSGDRSHKLRRDTDAQSASIEASREDARDQGPRTSREDSQPHPYFPGSQSWRRCINSVGENSRGDVPVAQWLERWEEGYDHAQRDEEAQSRGI